MNKSSQKVLTLAAAITLSACPRAAQEPNPHLPPFKPAASIQDPIASIVDPSACAPILATSPAFTWVPLLVDFAGRQLHGAPKVIANTGFNYANPVGRYLGRVFLNESYAGGKKPDEQGVCDQCRHVWPIRCNHVAAGL